ncbi:MAG: AraC family transcriptional regulator [Thalassovita sp.]
MGKVANFLNSYPVLRTCDLDQARAAVSARYCEHRLNLSSGRDLDVRHNHVRGAHVSLNLLSYGGDVSIDPGELNDFYLLQIPLSGAARIQHRNDEIDASPRRGTILNPDRPSQMEWRADCTKLMVQIRASFLNSVAEQQLGAALPGPIRFDTAVNLERAQGRRLRQLAAASARAVEAGILPVSQQTLTTLSAERQMALNLLMLQPSNISHILAHAQGACTSPQLRRAVEFIQTSFHEDIRLEDIAKAAGAHPRTVQTGFRQHFGLSPIAYLRDVRLDQARYRLGRRMNRESVTDVAFGCGYSHLGRFSRDYRARFGFAPSATP